MNNGHGKTKGDVTQRGMSEPHGAENKAKFLHFAFALCILLFAIGLVSCPQPDTGPEPDIYTVTVTQPANGGTVSANPASGPAGTVITLSNSPGTEYTFSHYTLDGEAIVGSAFTLAKNVTVSGTFTYTGAETVYTVTVPSPQAVGP